ncbi:RNA polymerase sigma-70 factor, ECF subfamily [Quadrisphaera granulorum]|uniref:RNA polymerase sigma-70 factor (ECF subfamily) n=1 Tax=Quadrisphaera granulorum TaxID=317664 RepID=A0A316AB72_9ACTN|nr:RNA polymerase sigma factor [Quadrisphaera granulorum]PWJ54963.1 RNA polymerase sigma-70 factor (ECF subfamily) [Quadrisphaera granulorum]SZE95909.1 RNA polymerase sigma-70 factor, ECF subfamily [Quadrisphaera granulorum]
MSTDAELWTTPPPDVDHHTSFTTVYDRHATAVYRYAYSLTGDPDTAQDLLQETFLTTWRRRDHLDLATDSLLGWLLVTCRNLAANHRRHSARRRTVALLDDDAAHLGDRQQASHPQDLADRLERDEELRWVLQAIGQLTPTDRRLVELCLIQERSYAQAAAELGLTLASATKRISRTRAHLRALRTTREQES